MAEVTNLKNKYYVYLLILMLGVFIGLYISSLNPNQSNNKYINNADIKVDDSDVTALNIRLEGLEQQSEMMASSLAGVSQQLNVLTQSLSENNYTNETTLNENTKGNNRTQFIDKNEPPLIKENTPIIGEEEASLIKENLYAELSNASMTLPDLVNKKEMQLLSQNERREVYEQVARMLDSGEINKSQFLPGYKEQ